MYNENEKQDYFSENSFTDAANNAQPVENSSNGNFSGDLSVDEKNSIHQKVQPVSAQTDDSQLQPTYCADHTPGSGAGISGYSTAYYTVVPERKTSATFSMEENTTEIYSNSAKQHKQQKNRHVKKITSNRIAGTKKAVIVACICLSLILGIATGSLISSYIFRRMSNESGGFNSQGSQSTGTNISPDNNTSGNSTSGFLTYAIEDKDTSALSTAEIAAKCGVSVVEIRTETVITGKWMQEYVTEGAGSGVILTADGYITTNNHVIEDASKITVTLQDGTSYEAKLIGTDQKSDIALIKIEASNLTPASIGNSDELVVGEKAVAIGNPLGELGGTVTDGIISALDREITIDGTKMSLLQTNAAINPGNSGGGLFNGAGNLIAIVDAKSSGEGIEGLGFAIPVNKMVSVVEQLMEYGYVKGYTDTGMTLIDISDSITAMQYRVNNLGVYVLKVTGENAEKAGFQSGDLITKVAGQEISSSSDIDSLLSEHRVGETVEFEVYRGRGTLTLSLTLSEYIPNNSNQS